jgi:hypothetical protein
MSHTVPTAAEFKARHTAFAAVADGTVDTFLAEASRSVSTCWAEADYADAIMYLAAHLYSEEQSAGGIKAASKAGPIKRVKADTVEIEYAGSFLSDANLSSTVYGRRFLALRQRNVPAVLVV